MLGLYSAKRVRLLVKRLREEYEEALERQKALSEDIREENRMLKARVLKLEEERGGVAEALLLAAKEGERAQEERKRETENAARELSLLAERCRSLADRLTAKCPEASGAEEVREFTDKLREELGEQPEESGFDMEEVLSPKQPLDLEKLCKDLGLMEDEG